MTKKILVKKTKVIIMTNQVSVVISFMSIS